jgi:hypothetical protein
MAAGARALAAAGADTVVACPGWEVDAEGSPRLSPVLAGAVRWGSASSYVGKSQLWRLQLALQPAIGDTMLSMTLRTLAGLRFPGLEYTVQLDASRLSLRLQAFRANPRLPGVRAPVEEPLDIPVNIQPVAADVPEFGLRRGDLVATYQVDPPPTPVFDAATWDYAGVFAATPESLRSWCTRKAVIIYDARADIDRHDHPDGRHLPGSFAHATGLEQLLRHDAVQAPSTAATWLLAALGAIVALPLVSRGPARGAVSAALAVVAVMLLCLLAYRIFHTLVSPIAPALALLLCAGIVLSLPRPRPPTTRSLT